MSSFENKVAIVTGCSSGIGLATIQSLLSRGAKVFGIDKAPFTHEATLSSYASTFSYHQCDLTSPDAVALAVTACTTKFGGRIDILCNVAGVMDSFGSADTLQDAEWERVMAINLTVPVKMMGAVIPIMKEQGSGAIVNVGSRASTSGGAAGIAYTASKHGLAGATKNVAWRFHREGIRCNAVLPGGVPTNISASMPPAKWDHKAFGVCMPVIDVHSSFKREDLPRGCIGVDDVAGGILYLASDEAKMVNGILMPIDNAWSAI